MTKAKRKMCRRTARIVAQEESTLHTYTHNRVSRLLLLLLFVWIGVWFSRSSTGRGYVSLCGFVGDAFDWTTKSLYTIIMAVYASSTKNSSKQKKEREGVIC